MLAAKNDNFIYKTFIFTLLLLLLCNPAHAQKKKKKKYKKKSDANIIGRAYNDITTRNNYYFNANNIYKEMLADIETNTEINYDSILPIYIFERVASFDTYSGDLESIIKKTSEAMLLHDNTRWKDNVYLLLGKARFHNGEYHDALKTFQFVVTTMKKDVGKTKSKENNKDKLREAQAKERAKAAAARKKEIERKKAAIKEQLAKLKRSKEKKAAADKKKKKKALAKRMKAKKKIIELRKKGKKPSQKLIALSTGAKDDDEKSDSKEEKTKEEEKESTITYKINYESERKKKKKEAIAKANEEAELADTIPLTEKQIRKYNDLSLWDKIKHKHSRPEALVWMALSYMEIGEYANAQSMLEYAEALPKLTRKQKEQIYAGEAYFYLHRNRHENALQALANAVIFAKRKNRSKYSFIMAQIHALNERPEDAVETFRAVAEGKTNYEMRFYANMRVAELQLESNDMSNSEAVIAMLKKLLRNGSNKEFRDQIHYKIAAIYNQLEDTDNSIDQLQQSITTSRDNPTQKGLSFQALGETYFNLADYHSADIFYDSAVSIIPSIYPKADAVKARAASIKDIAQYMETITVQDSLLMMSKMTPKEREIFLAELRRNERVESRKRKNKGVTDFIDNAVTVNTTNTLSNTGDWYFYNPSLVSKGKETFKLIWGDTKLEENWRRSDKLTILDANPDDANLIESIAGIDEALKEKRNPTLKIPETDAEKEEANKKIMNAYYEAGKVFRNNLEANPQAKQAFEAIVNKYPEFKSIDRVYYYLYLIYNEEGDLARADYYKNIIENEYPNSQYTLAMNTDYKFNRDNDEKKFVNTSPIEQLYISTYDAFLDSAYVTVINQRDEAFERYQENPLMPKFDFLAALSYGHLDSLVVLKSKLSEIISKYPNHEVQKKAQEYLLILNRLENEEATANQPADSVTVKNEAGEEIEIESIYSSAESNNMFAFLIIKNKSADIRTMIQSLNTYNSTNFAARKLRVSNAFFDKETPLILIKRFREESLAKEYYANLEASLEELFPDQSDQVELLVISQENFRTLFTTKKMDEYKAFFYQTFVKP